MPETVVVAVGMSRQAGESILKPPKPQTLRSPLGPIVVDTDAGETDVLHVAVRRAELRDILINRDLRRHGLIVRACDDQQGTCDGAADTSSLKQFFYCRICAPFRLVDSTLRKVERERDLHLPAVLSFLLNALQALRA